MNSSPLWGFGEGKMRNKSAKYNTGKLLQLNSWRNSKILSFSIETHILDLGTTTFFESAQPIFELTGNEL